MLCILSLIWTFLRLSSVIVKLPDPTYSIVYLVSTSFINKTLKKFEEEEESKLVTCFVWENCSKPFYHSHLFNAGSGSTKQVLRLKSILHGFGSDSWT